MLSCFWLSTILMEASLDILPLCSIVYVVCTDLYLSGAEEKFRLATFASVVMLIKLHVVSANFPCSP